MITYTKQLNEIVRNFSRENAVNSVSQITSMIDQCYKDGIKFSFDTDYEQTLSSFTANNFPDWNEEAIHREFEILIKRARYEAAASKRNEILSLKAEIHKQLRLEKYGTEDWFISKTENEIFFIPTHIAVIDNLIPGYQL
ncbi:MAG: hypothetical protein ACK5JQ_14430 [Bacteroidota bacterium]|jgi:hypothetical protein